MIPTNSGLFRQQNNAAPSDPPGAPSDPPGASRPRPQHRRRRRDTEFIGRPVGRTRRLPGSGPASGTSPGNGGGAGAGQMDFGEFFSGLFSGGEVVAIPTPVDGYRDGGGVNMNLVIGAAVVGGAGFLLYRWWRNR